MTIQRITEIRLNPNYWNRNQFIEFRLLGLPVVWMNRKEAFENKRKKSIYIVEIEGEEYAKSM